MENYFQIIPPEVITSISKSLDIKSLCNFIMCSKEFKQICDNNDIWRHHYYRTIHHKWIIKEDSIHLYRNWNDIKNYCKYLYEFNDGYGEISLVESFQKPDCHLNSRIQSCDEFHIWDHRKNVKFIKVIGTFPSMGNGVSRMWNGDHWEPSLKGIASNNCMECQQDELIEANIIYYRQPGTDVINWQHDIYKKWTDFNKKNGYKCLCQDPTHYDINTLDEPVSCKEWKSFKKQIISKLMTKDKQTINIKKLIRDRNKKSDEIKNMKENLKLEKMKLIEYNQNIKKVKGKTKRLKDAIELLK